VEVAVLPAGRRDKEAGGLPGPPPAVPKDEKHLKLTPALPREGAERQRPAPAVPPGLLFPRRHAGFVNAPFRRDTGLKPHLVQRERPWIDQRDGPRGGFTGRPGLALDGDPHRGVAREPGLP